MAEFPTPGGDGRRGTGRGDHRVGPARLPAPGAPAVGSGRPDHRTTVGPTDLSELPGVGRYTAAAVAAQVDDDDHVGIEVNIRRVCERVARHAPHRPRSRGVRARASATGLRPRDRLLALMDLGATVCTARAPACERCPIVAECATRGTHDDETKHRQGRASRDRSGSGAAS